LQWVGEWGLLCESRGEGLCWFGKAGDSKIKTYRIIVDTAYFQNDSSCTGVSLKFSGGKNENGYSYIYPNPASDQAILKYILPVEERAWFIIYDFVGHEINRYKLNAKRSELRFNLNELNPGLYLYKIVDGNKVISFGKFTVIR
jgi:hypothetical protein